MQRVSCQGHLPSAEPMNRHDELPESAFLFAGTIDDVFAKAKKG